MTTAVKRRQYTAELRKGQKQGLTVVASMQPFEGREVTYAPRTKGDPSPWVLGGTDWRFTGRECHLLTPEGKSLYQAPKAVRPLGEIQKLTLEHLRRDGGSWDGGGWVWDNYSGTVRIMEGLAKRGLVTKAPFESRHREDAYRYTITDAGKQAVPTVEEIVQAKLAERAAERERAAV